MNVKDNASEGSNGSKEHSWESSYHFREYSEHREQNTARNMNVKGTSSGEALDENEEHVIGNWSKGNSCYKMAENLADWCSTTELKPELDLYNIFHWDI